MNKLLKNSIPFVATFALAAALPWCLPSKTLEAGPTTCVGCKMTMADLVPLPTGTTVQMIATPGSEQNVNGSCLVNSADTCVADSPCQMTFMLSVTVTGNAPIVHTRFEDEFGEPVGNGPDITPSVNGDSQLVEYPGIIESNCEGAGGASANVIFFLRDNKGKETVVGHYRVYCSACDTIRN